MRSCLSPLYIVESKGLQNLCCEFESYCPCLSSLHKSRGDFLFMLYDEVKLTKRDPTAILILLKRFHVLTIILPSSKHRSQLLQFITKQMYIDIVSDRHVRMAKQFRQLLDIAPSLIAIACKSMSEHMLTVIWNPSLTARFLGPPSKSFVT